jgi:DNA-binding LytR/AlgR family response regulator
MLTISLANFLFARILIFGFIQWDLFPHMIYGTFMIGIIPMLVLGGFSLLVQEKKYQKIAASLNKNKQHESQKENLNQQLLFDIPISQVRYVEALQNYVSIAYLDSDGIFKKSVQRTTLKNILEQGNEDSIIMCHRSYLVNPRLIISISGNAQGLLLTLTDCDKAIPVSRSYVPIFRAR